jgi:CRP-like cAMP-binding protein
MNPILELFGAVEKKYPDSVSIHTLERNAYLIREGQVEQYSYFIESGAVKVVYEDSERSQIIRFGYRGSILNSLPSFFDDSPSLFDIVALRRTVVHAYSKSALFTCIEENAALKQSYISILEGLVRQFVEREIDLLTPDPLERYHRVLERSPELFQEVPLKHIADYLRMAPETLSRLRKS